MVIIQINLYIYISDFGNLTNISLKELVPMGFGKVYHNHITNLDVSNYQAEVSAADISIFASFVGKQMVTKNNRGSFDQNVYYGFDFNSKDSQQYLAPLPTSVAGR